MDTIREHFGLLEYSEEVINKVIHSRMVSPAIPVADVAKELNITESDVNRILSATAIVWNH